jgi:hypothetical protein
MATNKTMSMGVIAAMALALSTGAAFADHFVGTWKVKDSGG